MPNHVTQVLKIEGPDAFARMGAYFTDFDQTDDLSKRREQWRAFDFGKVIPRPAIVDTIVENGSDRYIPFLMNLDGAYLLWEQLRASKWVQLKERPLLPWQGYLSMREGWMETQLRHTFGDEPIDNAYRMIKCFAETGCKGWYEWSVAHWGTKWGAYSSSTEPEGSGDFARIKFNTAWCPPRPVLERLAAMESALAFDYVAVNEHTECYFVGAGRDGKFVLSEQRECTRDDEEFIAAHIACYGGEPEWYDEDETQTEHDPDKEASE